MPEGPEVKFVGKNLEKLEGKVIKRALVVSGRYLRGLIHDLETINGLRVEAVGTKGKLITFYLRGGHEPIAILSTLGMTGWWVILDTKDHEWDKYRRIELQFEDGTVAAFFDPRNFGTFKVVSHSEAKRKQAELGPDILAPQNLWNAVMIPEFKARLQRFGKKLTLAEALLDQRICSGCGNYIRADAMYLARLSPHREVSRLSDEDITNIWTAMGLIAKYSEEDTRPPTDLDGTPIHENVDLPPLPPGFINLCYHQGETPTGGKIEAYTDKNGRTVWFSPTEQS